MMRVPKNDFQILLFLASLMLEIQEGLRFFVFSFDDAFATVCLEVLLVFFLVVRLSDWSAAALLFHLHD